MTKEEQIQAIDAIFHSIDIGYFCSNCEYDCDALEYCPIIRLYQELTGKEPPVWFLAQWEEDL